VASPDCEHDFVPHGFRSTFNDWGIAHGYPQDILDRALGHIIRDKVQRAYQRDPQWEEIRAALEAWGAFLDKGELAPGERVILYKRRVKAHRYVEDVMPLVEEIHRMALANDALRADHQSRQRGVWWACLIVAPKVEGQATRHTKACRLLRVYKRVYGYIGLNRPTHPMNDPRRLERTPGYYSTAEAAKAAGISKTHLYRAIDSGKLPAVRNTKTGCYEIDPADVRRVYPLRATQEAAD
jgi:excisionase family DNA binding protein